MSTIKTIPISEYIDQLRAQGVPQVHLAVTCPMCGTVQSATDLINAGAGKSLDDIEKYLGFSCIGRWTHQKPPPKKKGEQKGCNWTLGGLFCIRNIDVETPDGKKHPRFEVSTPEEAQQHMRENQA